MNLSAYLRARHIRDDATWTPSVFADISRALKDDRAIALALELTPHFTLRELLHSDTAKARGIANDPNAAQLAALRHLCIHILEPVRAKFGPVRITSGFRIFTPASQHGRGEAADFEVTGVANIIVARWIRDTLPFDQLILEAWSPDDPNAGWVHTSATVRQMRKSVLRTPTGGPPYFAGLPQTGSRA